MALTRARKEQLVKEYGERLGRAQVVIWSQNMGLSVSLVAELRRQLRQAGAESVIVKNTLMRLALGQIGLPAAQEFMEGPSLVTFVYDDIAPAARAVVDFARLNDEVLEVKGGLIGGKVADVDQVRSLTTLPSRDVLLARVVGGIQAPVSGLVNVLSGVIRGFANVLEARRQQLETSA